MSIGLDKKGFPVIYQDDINLAIKIVPTKTGQGNPAHDTFTGKFSFLPSGVSVIKGENLLKSLSTQTRKIFFERAQIARANQVSARVINGRLHIVLLNNGRRIDSFVIEPRRGQGQPTAQEGRSDALRGSLTGDPRVRDAVTDAARQGLEGDKLKKFLEERGIDTSDVSMSKLLQLIDEQRKNDVVDYLDQVLRKQVHKENQIDRVRIAVGRGFLRQVFSRYNEGEIMGLLKRLQGRGWSEDIIHSNVISKLPAKLRDPIQSSFRKASGKKEVESIKKDQDVQAKTKQDIPAT